MQKVRVAMMQMTVKTNCPDENLNHARMLLETLPKDRMPDFALFPESCDIGWASAEAPDLATEVPGGQVCQTWMSLAAEFGTYIVAGMTERDGDKIYNTAVFISREGKLLAKHRKLNVLQDVEGIYEIGDRLNVAETEFGRIGFDICADNFISNTVLLHSLARMGARMILSPSAWAVTPDYDNEKTKYGSLWTVPYSRLAALYRMPVFGVSNVGYMTSGPWAGHLSIGNSMAFDAEGNEIIILPFGADEERVHIVETTLCDPVAKGTDFAEALLARGYTGQAEDTGLFPKGHGDGSVKAGS